MTHYSLHFSPAVNHSLQIIDISHFDSWLNCCLLLSLYLIVDLDTLDTDNDNFSSNPAQIEELLKRKIKVGSTYPEIWTWSGHSWLLTGLVGKAKIKLTWNLNTGRGASETENIQFQFHTELFPLSFHIFSILLCSGCDSLLPALNYSRHDNLVKQRGGAFDRNQNRTSGDNQI